jgi:hypothetical protein
VKAPTDGLSGHARGRSIVSQRALADAPAATSPLRAKLPWPISSPT